MIEMISRVATEQRAARKLARSNLPHDEQAWATDRPIGYTQDDKD
jgi:hypothetical protein